MTITVGELKDQLARYPDDHEIALEGGLTFNRLKRRGKNLTVLEFCEFQADLPEEFKEANPDACVVFKR